MWKTIAAAVTRANVLLGALSSHVFVIVTAVTAYDVLARYLFNAPTFWALELSIMLAGSQFMLGAVLATAEDSHIRIDGLYLLASPRRKRLLDLFGGTVALFYLVFAAAYAWNAAARAITVWETSASIWDSPSPTIMKTVIALALSLMAVQVGLQILGRALRWDAPRPPDTAAEAGATSPEARRGH